MFNLTDTALMTGVRSVSTSQQRLCWLGSVYKRIFGHKLHSVGSHQFTCKI